MTLPRKEVLVFGKIDKRLNIYIKTQDLESRNTQYGVDLDLMDIFTILPSNTKLLLYDWYDTYNTINTEVAGDINILKTPKTQKVPDTSKELYFLNI